MKRYLFCLSLAVTLALPSAAAPTQLVDEAPSSIQHRPDGSFLIDFGKVSFANLRLAAPAGRPAEITVHLGESLLENRVNRKPPGSVRYAAIKLSLDGKVPSIAAPAPDKRNTTHPSAVLTPPEWGVILPFRWVEIEGWPGELCPEHITRRSAFLTAWDDSAASFTSSDPRLNGIWELCKYSIKATTFAGIYVDGDRERIPYEADAYLNQISHYTTDRDLQIARDSFDFLIKKPTWPSEWPPHMVFMAYADFMHTADIAWLAPRYEALKSKLLTSRARADGLIQSNAAQISRDDIVDWPTTERDGYVFTPINTVVNAFHLRTLTLMAEMATALGKTVDAEDFTAREKKARAAFQEILFNPATGSYRDGEGTDHSSQHANLFSLAFHLVPEENRVAVTRAILQKQMACSVYAAQYLLEGLFQNELGREALTLITAPTDRSWKHMFESGTTITWEAWDQKHKPNQDWNHAWGAAPANLFPRFILGAQALTPGWKRTLIRPHPGDLKSASGKIPTPSGPILIQWENANNFRLTVTLPVNLNAQIELPATPESSGVMLNGQSVSAKRVANRWILSDAITGTATLEVK
ncbi:MAG: family 78 glycoside hydrolase catalytic domain [Gloeobacteraceae cyanobacterium ES-bin-144]|nr:family 78 glycoside hydrolase catalytic domain [Verrucomicrobiales bacterium]